MLADALAIKRIRHAAQLYLAMHRLVGDAEQCAVRHTQAKPVGGDGGALHVDGDGARLVEARIEILVAQFPVPVVGRSEEHTSELQSLMRISYAVFCLKKKKTINHNDIYIT